jgi:AraC-like DNA-binding protein
MPTETIVQTTDHSTSLRPFAEKTFYFRRSILRPHVTRTIDVYGRYWGFLLGQIPDSGSIRVWTRGELLSHTGSVATFLPPFSVVEWHVSPCLFELQGVFSLLPVPEGLPAEPRWFRSEGDSFPSSIGEIALRVRAARDPLSIGRVGEASALALRTKRSLDENYRRPDLRLSDLARSFRCAEETMARAFKRCYGLSPVQYRVRLRIQDSLARLVMSDHSVISVAHEVGFTDLSQFNRQFRRQTQSTPTKFRT